MPAKPKLGQNFLIDPTASHRIVDALGDISARTVIEIGPGRGAITHLLANRCQNLILVELDSALAAVLRTRYAGQPHITVLEQDILAFDAASVLAPGTTADVIGNLPYYITSDILLHLFANAQHLGRAVLMMQREVADRVAAAPGISDFGLLSATAQMHALIDNLFTLPPSAFAPPPSVYSSVLRLTFAPRFAALAVDPPGFDRFLKICFRQKRKTLSNNLRTAGLSPAIIQSAFNTASIPSAARAETLPLETLAALYRALLPHFPAK